MAPQSIAITFTLDIPNIPEATRLEAERKAKEAYVMALVEQGAIPPQTANQLLEPSQNGTSQNQEAVADIEAKVKSLTQQMAEQGMTLTESDLKGLRAYLKTKPQWEEVYRRLADS